MTKYDDPDIMDRVRIDVPEWLEALDPDVKPATLVDKRNNLPYAVLVSEEFFHWAIQVMEDLEDLLAVVEHQDQFSGLANMLRLLHEGKLWGETDLRREFGVNR